MRFEWDEEKNRRNLAKHGIRFGTAALVFDDLHALTQIDPFSENEERWITLSLIESTVLFVVCTWFEREEKEVIRIISARAATPKERRVYEEAHQGTERRHRPARRHERRRH